MIAKPIALIQIPNQRLFGLAAAARYLDKHKNTVRKLADLGIIKARVDLNPSRMMTIGKRLSNKKMRGDLYCILSRSVGQR